VAAGSVLRHFHGESLCIMQALIGEKSTPRRVLGLMVAVGTTIADRPPHRTVRAALPHTAPTLDE
jgi:hypothetical protein